MGAALRVVGHGLRDRQQRGPVAAGATPAIVIVLVRRYLCRRCHTVMTVVPRDVEPRRHYSWPTIALALARLALLGESAATVRRGGSLWSIAETSGLPALRRNLAPVRCRSATVSGSSRPTPGRSCARSTSGRSVGTMREGMRARPPRARFPLG
jgi:hypothetical protein